MINTIYSVDCNCSHPIAMSNNVIKQLIVRRKLEEYEDVDHRENKINFKSIEDASAFVEWFERTEFPEYAGNTIFPNHDDMLREKGTLDAAYFEIDKDRQIVLSPSGITIDMYKFWKNITNLLVGNMYVLNFDNKQVIAFDRLSDVPLFQSIISGYSDDTFPFTQSTFAFTYSNATNNNTLSLSNGVITTANIATPSITIDLDNTIFTKGGKTVNVKTK